MYSHTDIQSFKKILSPLIEMGTIDNELFSIALKAVNDNLSSSAKPSHKEPEALISRKEAANLLNCCTKTIDRLVRMGKLKTVRYGTKSIKFRRTDITLLYEASSDDNHLF